MWRNPYVDAVQVFSEVPVCWILQIRSFGGASLPVLVWQEQLCHQCQSFLFPASVSRGDSQKSVGFAGCIVLGLGARGTTWTLSYARSVLGLGRTAGTRLSSRHAVLILLGNRSLAGVWVDRSGSRTIAANSLATRIFDAVGVRR
jgi:hypothetical protein